MHVNPYSIAPFVSSMLAFVLGWVALWHNPRSAIHRGFFFLCMSVFSWPFSLSVILNSTQRDTILLWTKIGHTTCTLAPAVFVYFVLKLLHKDRLRWLYRTYFVLAAVFITLMWGTQQYFPGGILWYRWGPYATAGPIVTLDAVVATTAVLWCWPLLIAAVRRAKSSVSSHDYNQLRYFRLALFLFSFALLDYLPKYGIDFPPIGSYFIAAFAAVVTYAIVRHQLLDITIAVKRTVLYSVLAAVISGMYFGLVFIIERTLQGVIGYRSLIGSVLAGFAIAICFNPFKEVVQRFIDRFLFHGGQTTLVEENERLRHELTRTERLKSVATLAAGMAHEIKNPLAAIKTFAEYMPDKFADPAYREKYSKIMGQEVEKMNALVHRLLEFARPGAPRLQRVEPAALLRETLEFLQGTLVEKQVQVDLALTSHAAVQGDPGQLKQVFLNLFLNSIDAIEPPGRLMVSAHQENGHVRVTITDTGCGIAKADLPRIFDPFFTRKSGGTGLGLSVVHSIVQEHGGRINVDSVLGIGTTIHISLPTYGGSNGATAHPDR